MKKILLSLFFLSCFLPCLGALAQEAGQSTLPQGEFSALKRGDLTTVAKVINPQTVQLSDGTLVRLIGLRFPDLTPYEAGDFALTAQKVLKDMLEGQSVQLYITEKTDWGRVDRMGNRLAQIERQHDKAWIQGALLRLGLAEVDTGQRNPEMAAQMYAMEEQARAEKLGIWENGDYRILSPEETPDHLQSFQIVEGRVESVAIKNNRIYINFGKDWRTDFTVSIKSEDKRYFSKQMINPLDWGGQVIRVRGWLDEYNGPYIEINHPEAVEIISK